MSASKYGLNYEANFGFYDFDADPNEEDFFIFVRANSRPATCVRCLEAVALMPGRTTCARCLEAREFGGQG